MESLQIRLILFGLAVILAALSIRYRVGRRRFERRNAAGLQQFENYGQLLWVTFCEGLQLLVALLFGLAGLALIAAALYHQTYE